MTSPASPAKYACTFGSRVVELPAPLPISVIESADFIIDEKDRILKYRSGRINLRLCRKAGEVHAAYMRMMGRRP